MNKYLYALALLFAFVTCTPENNNNGESGGNQNNPEELTITGDALDVTDRSAMLTGYANLPFELGDAEVGIMYDKGQSFADAKKVVATGLDGSNKFTVTATGLEASTTYYFKSYVQNGMTMKSGAVKYFTTKESMIPEGAVDLGIVMAREDGTTYKLYWAKSNLSTSGLCANPKDYGDYYAWGETEPKSDYSWSTYKWCNGDSNSLTKYNTDYDYGNVDNKTVLDPEDDAARAILGGNWRMPTNAEWQELLTQCTWTWTTQNDVYGRLVTASNGNSIFLPAAGGRHVTDLYYAGSNGYYWSSSLNRELYPYSVLGVYFNSDSFYKTSLNRYRGFSVRPVSE
jgi:uncharacterized protein (TIGR02145 family)